MDREGVSRAKRKQEEQPFQKRSVLERVFESEGLKGSVSE